MYRLIFFAIVIVLLLAGIATALYVVSSHSTLSFEPPPKVIGMATPVKLKIVNPHGVRRVTAMLEQNRARTTLHEEAKPASRLLFWRRHDPPREIAFTAKGSQDGKARLIVEVQANDLGAAVDTLALEVDVILRPLTLAADGLQHYINQGGAELVSFTPSGYWTEAGVRVGSYTFRSFPKPGAQGERFAFFVFPWDTDPATVPVVYARNPTGAEVTARFWNKVFPNKHRARELPLDDTFLEKVVSELDPGGAGDLLSRFLKINGQMRRANNATLAALRLKTREKIPWSGPFLQLSNSKVESQFADVRSYSYKGQKVDQQVHLGFDLSVTRNVAVPAANDGVVVHADRLGIYGNCVVIDHGYGLQSIYGHLSEIGVKPGEAVKRGQAVGKSGATGLAGGDHLHFSMQLDGVQTTPLEWWDEHWLHDHVWSRLGQ